MKKSILKVGAMLLMASVTLTSCQDFWDDLFGVESTPTTPETPSTPSESEEPKNDTNLTKTETGAEATVEDLANLTELLDQVKDDIAAKGGEEYVFEIKNEGLESTATDNVIEVPKVEGSNINLTFTNAVSTKQTLVVKAAETASDTPVEAVNELTITMPASEGLNLELDMPETTVTLNAASGEVVYEEVVATTAINTLYIESGVTVRNLQVKGGVVIVKDGGKAETYVYAPTSNDEIVYIYSDGVLPVSIKDANGNELFAVQDNSNNAYFFKNLKIIKGIADYANIAFYNNRNPIEKLTIAEGVTFIRAIGDWPSAKIIEAEGNRAELIQKYELYLYERNGKNVAHMQCSLSGVTEMKGITFSLEPETEEQKEMLATADSIDSRISLPNNAENCTFISDRMSWDSQDYKSTGSFKNCKFEAANAYANLPINISCESSLDKVNFTGCQFSGNFKFDVYMHPFILEEDGNGNPVYYDTPFYEYYDEYYDWVPVQTQEEIPARVTEWREIDDPDYKQQKKTLKYGKDYASVVIKDCQFGGSALTSSLNFFNDTNSWQRFEINGVIYQTVWDATTSKYVLKPVQ